EWTHERGRAGTQEAKGSPLPCALACSRACALLDPQRHRTVVDEVDVHHGAEDAGGDGPAEGLRELRGEVAVEPLGLLGRGGVGEGGPRALADLAEEGELADDEGLAAGVEER